MTNGSYSLWLASLSASIDQMLANAPAKPMSNIEPIDGSGLYAIFYTGKHQPVLAYEPTAKRNRRNKWGEPIYIGVARATGAAAKLRSNNPKVGKSLYNALRRHAASIAMVKEHMTLDLRDFHYKVLPVDMLNAEVAKMVLMDRYAPIWNTVVRGFANHHVGRTRFGQRRARWDILHMGREWGAECQWNEEGTMEILADLRTHYLHRENVRKQMGREARKLKRIQKQQTEQKLAA